MSRMWAFSPTWCTFFLFCSLRSVIRDVVLLCWALEKHFLCSKRRQMKINNRVNEKRNFHGRMSETWKCFVRGWRATVGVIEISISTCMSLVWRVVVMSYNHRTSHCLLSSKCVGKFFIWFYSFPKRSRDAGGEMGEMRRRQWMENVFLLNMV